MIYSEENKAAKAAAIYELLSGYWQLAEKLNDALLATYERAVEECDVESVALVCSRIASGQAGLNTSFPPTPADIAERARLLDEGRKPSPELYNGLIEMDWGHGRVDMRGLTTEEQDVVIRAHGKLGELNLALVSLDGKRAAIRSHLKRLAAPKREDSDAGR
jgi:hypothetical protein